MAPLPPETTSRLWVDYTDGIHTHSLMWRFNNVTSNSAECQSNIHTWLTAIAPNLFEITILGMRLAGEGSTVSFPGTWTGSSSYGTGAQTAVNAPVEIRYEGRSVTGRKVHAGVYGYKEGLNGAYRIVIVPESALEDGLVALQSAASTGAFVCIDESTPIFKDYVNIQNNSYWERKARV